MHAAWFAPSFILYFTALWFLSLVGHLELESRHLGRLRYLQLYNGIFDTSRD